MSVFWIFVCDKKAERAGCLRTCPNAKKTADIVWPLYGILS